jgi:hypothetical protein
VERDPGLPGPSGYQVPSLFDHSWHLRQARRDYARRIRLPHTDSPIGLADQDQDLDETTLVVGSWRFAGIGWLTLGDAVRAVASAARVRDG